VLVYVWIVMPDSNKMKLTDSAHMHYPFPNARRYCLEKSRDFQYTPKLDTELLETQSRGG